MNDGAATVGVRQQRGAHEVADQGHDDAHREAGQAATRGGVRHQRDDGAGTHPEQGGGVEVEVEPRRPAGP